VTDYLLDTKVLSEAREGARADAGVRDWMAARDGDELFLSVLTIGELYTGVRIHSARTPLS
jgi:predicted nucleic acid-binding protein